MDNPWNPDQTLKLNPNFHQCNMEFSPSRAFRFDDVFCHSSPKLYFAQFLWQKWQINMKLEEKHAPFGKSPETQKYITAINQPLFYNSGRIVSSPIHVVEYISSNSWRSWGASFLSSLHRSLLTGVQFHIQSHFAKFYIQAAVKRLWNSQNNS